MMISPENSMINLCVLVFMIYASLLGIVDKTAYVVLWLKQHMRKLNKNSMMLRFKNSILNTCMLVLLHDTELCSFQRTVYAEIY